MIQMHNHNDQGRGGGGKGGGRGKGKGWSRGRGGGGKGRSRGRGGGKGWSRGRGGGGKGWSKKDRGDTAPDHGDGDQAPSSDPPDGGACDESLEQKWYPHGAHHEQFYLPAPLSLEPQTICVDMINETIGRDGFALKNITREERLNYLWFRTDGGGVFDIWGDDKTTFDNVKRKLLDRMYNVLYRRIERDACIYPAEEIWMKTYFEKQDDPRWLTGDRVHPDPDPDPDVDPAAAPGVVGHDAPCMSQDDERCAKRPRLEAGEVAEGESGSDDSDEL